MRIAELYSSTQGEGRLTGTKSIFLRTSGCNLRCRFCDTPYASWRPEGEDVSVHDTVRRVLQWDVTHVVVTGGEPLLWSELIPVCHQLREAGRHITVETAGTLYLPVPCNLMSISPKMSNSTPDPDAPGRWHARHERTRTAPNVLRRLMQEFDYQLKFVVDRRADLDPIQRFLSEYPQLDRQRVLLMPQGTDIETLRETEAWLEPYCLRHGLGFCPRKQIEWYGSIRRA